MKVRIIPVTPFQQNCTLLCCETNGEAILVDPGGEPERLMEAVTRSGARLVGLLLTHGHLDHVGAAATLARHYAIPIDGPQREDAFWLEALPEQCRMFGFPPTPPLNPDRWLQAGDRVRFGEEELEVLHCPGHTPGHLAFFHRAQRLALVGDVLFQGSVGRTDFPRSDPAALMKSIRDGLFPLGDDVRFIPGHGPTSTFGRERRNNPFVRDRLG